VSGKNVKTGSSQRRAVRRACSRTGFILVPPRRVVYRLAKPSYGPLNPLPRDAHTPPEHRYSWSRYDVAGHRTVYAATTAAGAYGELLKSLKPKIDPANKYFEDVQSGVDLESLIREEWKRAGHNPARQVDMAWLRQFRLYRLTLPTEGWFVDIEAARSLAAIVDHAPAILAAAGVTEVSVSELRSNERWLTTSISTQVWGLTLDDGSHAHGMRYGSRHGSDWNCWAIWLRNLKHGKPDTGPTTADAGTEVLAPALNQPLATILKTYGLTAG
jgi:hypothetical protein